MAESVSVLKGPVRVGDLSKPRPLRKRPSRPLLMENDVLVSGSEGMADDTGLLSKGDGNNNVNHAYGVLPNGDNVGKCVNGSSHTDRPASVNGHLGQSAGPTQDAASDVHTRAAEQNRLIEAKLKMLRRAVSQQEELARQNSLARDSGDGGDQSKHAAADSLRRRNSDPTVHMVNGAGADNYRTNMMRNDNKDTGRTNQPLTSKEGRGSRRTSAALSSTPQSDDSDASRPLFSCSSVDDLLDSPNRGETSSPQAPLTSSPKDRAEKVRFVKMLVPKSGDNSKDKEVTFMSTDTDVLTLVLALLQKDLPVRVIKMGLGTEDLLCEMGRQLDVSLVATQLHELPPGGKYSPQQLVDISCHPLSRRPPFRWAELAEKHPDICLKEVPKLFEPSDYKAPSTLHNAHQPCHLSHSDTNPQENSRPMERPRGGFGFGLRPEWSRPDRVDTAV